MAWYRCLIELAANDWNYYIEYKQQAMQVNKRNRGFSILGGILISGVILCPLYLAFLFLTFNLGGGETIREIESQNTAFLVLSLVLMIVIAVVITPIENHWEWLQL
jgi:uncharacterized membrane protein YbhN (UPF0104 family)